MRNLPSFAAILLGALPLLGATSASAANADSGRTAYANSCASCHGVPSSPWGVSAQSLQSAIQGNRGGMGRLSTLSATDLQDIAAYLADPSATTVATNNGTPTTTPSIPAPPTSTPTNSDSDRIFDWAESTNPQLFNSHSISENLEGYYLRYYPGTGVYLASQNGQLYYYNTRRPQEGVLPLGALSGWLNRLTQPTPATNTPARPGDDDNGREGGENHNGRDDNDRDQDSRDRD